jgi:hypothetical protein
VLVLVAADRTSEDPLKLRADFHDL